MAASDPPLSPLKTHRPLPALAALLLLSLGAVGCAASGGQRTQAACRGPAATVDAPVRSQRSAPDPVSAAAVARLTSPDFVERSKAAEQLVSLGVMALPALGAVGDQTAEAPGGITVSTTRPVLDAIFSAATADAVAEQLEAPWPTVRRGAAEELGRRGRWDWVPALITRLGDPDLTVRSASGASLRRLTNRFFGYRGSARTTARREATARWRTWWAHEGSAQAVRGAAPEVAVR